MFILGVYNVYTADDEDSKCIRCDNVNNDTICITRCGEKHRWNGYERRESIMQKNKR